VPYLVYPSVRPSERVIVFDSVDIASLDGLFADLRLDKSCGI